MKIVERDPAAWREVLLGAVLFLTALFALGRAAVPAQSTERPAETPLMRQLRQALRLAQQGDKQGAIGPYSPVAAAEPEICTGDQAAAAML